MPTLVVWGIHFFMQTVTCSAKRIYRSKEIYIIIDGTALAALFYPSAKVYKVSNHYDDRRGHFYIRDMEVYIYNLADISMLEEPSHA
jgi:hypothetical protein